MRIRFAFTLIELLVVSACVSMPAAPARVPEDGQYAFRSVHSGGVHLLFCDGASRFVCQSLPMVTYQAMGSRTGGEVVAHD